MAFCNEAVVEGIAVKWIAAKNETYQCKVASCDEKGLREGECVC